MFKILIVINHTTRVINIVEKHVAKYIIVLFNKINNSIFVNKFFGKVYIPIIYEMQCQKDSII